MSFTSRSRLPFIDGLRGVAMLMVLAFHCWENCFTLAPLSATGWHKLLILGLRHGYLGVHLFLVISGFCLTYPLARGGTTGLRLDLRRFCLRRARRILPPYYVALAFFCLLCFLDPILRKALGRPAGSVSPLTAGQILSHLLMLHNLSPAWVRSINGVFWSLALEWQLYMVFPLLIAGFRRWGLGRTLAAVLLVTLSYRSWVYSLHVGSGSWPLSLSNAVAFWLAYAQVPGRVFEFTLGMLAALLLASGREIATAAWTRRWQAAAVLFGLLALSVALGWSSFSPITDLLWGMAFFCLVMYGGSRVAGANGAAARGWLESRPLVFLGTISYSVYLIHGPLIRFTHVLLDRYHLSPLIAGVIYGFGVAPAMIGLGWLYYHAVEARFVQSGPRFADPPVTPWAATRLSACPKSSRS